MYTILNMFLNQLYHMPKLLCFLLLIFLLPTISEGQSPYQLDRGKESLIIGSSIGLLTVSRIKYRKLEPLTIDQLEHLKRQDIFAIDQKATYNYSMRAKKMSDLLLQSSIAMPLTMLAGEQSRKDFGKSSLFALEVLLLNTGLTDLTKVIVKRKRPYVYNEFAEINKKLTKSARASFFSGHTSTVASMYFLTAKLYSDYYPDSKWKPVVWSSAVLIPATTGFLRVKAGKHYFTDVLTGFIVGATIGYLVPEIHQISN